MTNLGDLSEGINVLHHDVRIDTYAPAEKTGMTIRWWSRHTNKDGSTDCFVITCPGDSPSSPKKA